MTPVDNDDRTATDPSSGRWLVRAVIALLGTGVLVGLLLFPMALWLRLGVMLGVAVAVIVILSGA